MNTTTPPQIKKTRYTVGLAFDRDSFLRERVMLIEKKRPNWQAGKLNGVGGKFNEGELSVDCMIREFKEETGLITTRPYWTHFCTLIGSDWEVDVYKTQLLDGIKAESMTDEIVSWHYVEDVLDRMNKDKYMKNIPWLVAMALSEDDIFATVEDSYP